MTLAFFEITFVPTATECPIGFSNINWPAALVSAFAAFMLAGTWYQALFGQAWAKAQGWSPERIEDIKKTMSPAKFFSGMIISYLVLATVMAAIITSISHQGMMPGVITAACIWVVIAAVTFTHQLASGRHINAWLIDASCEFVYFIIMGAIIGAWR